MSSSFDDRSEGPKWREIRQGDGGRVVYMNTETEEISLERPEEMIDTEPKHGDEGDCMEAPPENFNWEKFRYKPPVGFEHVPFEARPLEVLQPTGEKTLMYKGETISSACYKRDPYKLNILLAFGGDLNFKDEYGQTALHMYVLFF